MGKHDEGAGHARGERPLGDEDLRMEAVEPDAAFWADVARARELPAAEQDAARGRAFAAAAERERRRGEPAPPRGRATPG